MKSTQYYGLSNADLRVQGNSVEVTISVHNRGSQTIRSMPAAAGAPASAWVRDAT